MNWREYILVDPSICHGKACVKGSRILVTAILDNLAAGISTEELMVSYPGLSQEAVQAVIAYAAELAHDKTIFLSSAGPA